MNFDSNEYQQFLMQQAQLVDLTLFAILFDARGQTMLCGASTGEIFVYDLRPFMSEQYFIDNDKST
jgi:hypothetical protein